MKLVFPFPLALLIMGLQLSGPARVSFNLQRPHPNVRLRGGNSLADALGLSDETEIASLETQLSASLLEAAKTGNVDEVEEAVRNGAKVNTADHTSRTALHFAAKHGHTAVVEKLVLFGADLTSKDLGNSTALHTACARGHVETARKLIALGADVNVRGHCWQRPLHYAAANGHNE
eukprot:1761686-Rhodomonas_salina.1